MQNVRELGEKSASISDSCSQEGASQYDETPRSDNSSDSAYFLSDDSYYDETDDLDVMPFTKVEQFDKHNQRQKKSEEVFAMNSKTKFILEGQKLQSIFKLSIVIDHYLHKEKQYQYASQMVQSFPCFKNQFKDLNKYQII